jgi:hypothetical protein
LEEVGRGAAGVVFRISSDGDLDVGSHTPHARRSGGGFNLKNLGGVGEQVKKWFKALIP